MKSHTNPVDSPRLHLGWMLLSSLLLTAAWWIEPYLFAFAAISALALSTGLVGAASFIALKNRPPRYSVVLWALVAATPSVTAFLILQTLSWA